MPWPWGGKDDEPKQEEKADCADHPEAMTSDGQHQDSSSQQPSRSDTYRFSVARNPISKKDRLRHILLDKEKWVGMRKSQVDEIVKGIEDGNAADQMPELIQLEELLDELVKVEARRKQLKENAHLETVINQQKKNSKDRKEWLKGVWQHLSTPQSAFMESVDAVEMKGLDKRKKEIEHEVQRLQEKISLAYTTPSEIYTQNFQALEGDAYFVTMVAVDLLCFWASEGRLRQGPTAACLLQLLIFLACVGVPSVILVYLFFVNIDMSADACKITSHFLMRAIGTAIFVGEMFHEFVEATQLLSAYVGIRTAAARWFSFIFLVGPKFLIALGLLWVGTCFVVLSQDDTELLLNCLAMTFVVQIDEIVHRVLAKGRITLYWPEQMFLARLRHRHKAATEGTTRTDIQRCCASSFCAVLKAFAWAAIVAAFMVFSGTSIVPQNDGVSMRIPFLDCENQT